MSLIRVETDSLEAHCEGEGQWDVKGSRPPEQQNTLGILADRKMGGAGTQDGIPSIYEIPGSIPIIAKRKMRKEGRKEDQRAMG